MVNHRLFKNWILPLLTRLKNDALDLVRNIDISKIGAKRERKPINVWVAVLVCILSFFGIWLVIYMLGGVLSIVFGEVESDTSPFVFPETLVGLIIVSTALGALVLWFAAHPTEVDERKNIDTGIIKHVGKFFLFSALSFSLFMLLSPALPSIRYSTGFIETFVKYVTVLSLIGGSVTFAIADLIGLLYLWKL